MKKTMGLWIKRGVPGGKYLVVRRDGTVVEWPHFVLGSRDPATPDALGAYADAAERRGYDADFITDVRQLAGDCERHQTELGQGDPDAVPHRQDDPEIIRLMIGGGRVTSASRERAAVVAWLRQQAQEHEGMACVVFSEAADSIERAEHDGN